MPKGRRASEPTTGSEALCRALGAWRGSPEDWAVEIISEKGGENRRRLYRATDGASGESFAVKANHLRRRNREQYEALQALNRQAGETVRPLHIAEDDSFFVMEWVDAPRLEEQLTGRDRAELIRGAGAWLSRLHGSTAAPPAQLTRQMLQVPERCDGGAEAAVAARLEARLGRIDPPFCRLSTLHGDFTARNIFCTDRGLLVFDCQRELRGLPHLDVARFLVSLAVRRRMAWVPRRWPGDAGTDRRLFFEGYGAIPDVERELYGLVEDIEVFRRWQLRRERELHGGARRALEAELRDRGLLDGRVGGWSGAVGGLAARVRARLRSRLRP